MSTEHLENLSDFAIQAESRKKEKMTRLKSYVSLSNSAYSCEVTPDSKNVDNVKKKKKDHNKRS